MEIPVTNSLIVTVDVSIEACRVTLLGTFCGDLFRSVNVTEQLRNHVGSHKIPPEKVFWVWFLGPNIFLAGTWMSRVRSFWDVPLLTAISDDFYSSSLAKTCRNKWNAFHVFKSILSNSHLTNKSQLKHIETIYTRKKGTHLSEFIEYFPSRSWK